MKERVRALVVGEFEEVEVDYSFSLDGMVAAAKLDPDKYLSEYYPLGSKEKGLEVVNMKIIRFSDYIPIFPALRMLSRCEGHRHATLPELLALKAQYLNKDPRALRELLNHHYIDAPGSKYKGGLDKLFFIPSLALNYVDRAFPIACLGMENHSIAISRKVAAR